MTANHSQHHRREDFRGGLRVSQYARFRDALASLPHPGGNGYHPRLLGVANIGIRAGIPPADVAAAIRAHTPKGTRRVPDREITEAVNKAVSDHSPHAQNSLDARRFTARPRRPAFDASAFMAARLKEGQGIREADITAASPVCIDHTPSQHLALILRSLYTPDDILFIGDRYGRTVKPVAAWLDSFHAGRLVPPHIAPNPLSGEVGRTKNDRPSLRADSCVTSFRFAVAEFDGMSREDQLRFWWAVRLPVCALIDSGGKSLHAWLRIDGVSNSTQWDEIVEARLFTERLTPLGCDGACRNESRLSRLPGHFRSEKHRWQRLLYLCPDGRAIHARP